MEDGSSTPPNTMPETSSTDFNLMDDLLCDGFWLEASDVLSDFCQPDPTTSDTNNIDSVCTNPQPERDEFAGESQNHEDAIPSVSLNQSTRLWFGPNRNSIRTTISVEKRLVQAVDCLKDSIIDKDVLVQIWIPVKRGDRQVLTTNNQPFSLNPHCKNLADYRNVSENYQFSTDADSKEFYGLPGRVFLNKLPDWTPDVRFFKREEYPRVNHAQRHDVRGSLALPVFEQGSGICLGVVEIVTTSQKVNFSPELENVCKALEAVNLKSSNIQSPCNIEDQNEPYLDALTEIRNVLKFICDAHKLPLAQTWASCIQQRKGGCRHSDENYACCVSTIDSACYVSDEQVSGFHEACSGYHLLRGEGVVGKAFLTNQPCFSEDITVYSKSEYPLAHHARVFNLCASGAIRLRSVNNGMDDFVLEFFWPINCKDVDGQKLMLNSLSSVIQETCQSLRVITDLELAQEISHRESCGDTSAGRLDDENYLNLVTSPPEEHSHDASSRKGKGVAVSFANHKDGSEEESNKSLGAETSSEKRRTKIKKTITLEVLRKHYAGSLKEAAMSIGVCPTTLKRICRQHGIARWPSRKIKKVGHSLRKLEVVINSVQGADGSIQLSSFYNTFPELVSPNVPESSHLSTPQMGHHLQQVSNQPQSPSSSGEAKQAGGMLKRAQSEAHLHENGQGKAKLMIRSHSHKNFDDDNTIKAPAVAMNSNLAHVDTFRVKAALGEEKIRFRLQPQWGFKDLKEEVFRRFNVENDCNANLKYLDDDAEWVLLTCDADLEECMDIHRSSNSQTIKLSVNQAYHSHLGSSFGSSGPN